MQVPVLGLVQVSFHLQVRRADLVLVSTKELDILMNNMDTLLKGITDKGYLAKIQMTLDGVTTSINA